MYCFSGNVEVPENLFNRSQNALADLLLSASHLKEEILLAATTDLFAGKEHSGYLYVITEGSFSWGIEEAASFMFEAGDLIGLEEAYGYHAGRYATEFAVRCERYPWAEVLKELTCSPELCSVWNSFVASRFGIFNTCLLQALGGDKQFIPHIQTYRSGEVIIEQGTKGEEVFTLLNGHAEVLVDGIQVGEILADEIFGALAALNGMTRTATVITTKDSMILAMPKDKFIELIAARPTTVLKMVQDMARTIVDLNKKVVEKSKFYR